MSHLRRSGQQIQEDRIDARRHGFTLVGNIKNPYINIKRIEYIITYRCNSHCKHCTVGLDKRRSKPTAVNTEMAVKIIADIAGEFTPDSVMTFGGEPLLFPDTVCAIHAAARSYGIAKRDVITNAGVPASEAEFRRVAFRLADSGVNSVGISVDGFHQEYIPIDVLARNAKSLLDAGIPRLFWNPCWVVSPDHDNLWNRKTREVLRALEHLTIRESDGNIVSPSGNALINLREYMPDKLPLPDGSCEEVPYACGLDKITSISVEPNGDIAAGKNLVIGNAKKQNIIDILQNYNPNSVPELKAILHGGVAELADFAREWQIKVAADGYYSICDMCISLRRQLSQAGK